MACLLVVLSVATKGQNTPASTKNMVLVNTGTYFTGLDSAGVRRAMLNYVLPASYFSQERPAMRVTVASCYMDKYEVTNAQFKEFIDANPQWSKDNIPDSLHNGNYLKHWDHNTYPKKLINCPVVYVSWYVANAYARWKGKRLPMEAEWDYAAKGTQQMAEFPWGNASADAGKANYLLSGHNGVVPVGKYKPTPLGIYDMAGNAAEFCLDTWRQDKYSELADYKKLTYQYSPSEKDKAVLRGGSWQSPGVDLRTTSRRSISKTDCNEFVGFRCAMSTPKKVKSN